MTIKDYLANKYPRVGSVTVTVKEFCDAVHPPIGTEWSYSEHTQHDKQVTGKLFHDKTSLQTCQFDLCMPIVRTIQRNVTKHRGKLPEYWRDDGKAVSRSFVCEITLIQETAGPCR